MTVHKSMKPETISRRSFSAALLACLALAACDTDFHRPKKDNQATDPENSESAGEGSTT